MIELNLARNCLRYLIRAYGIKEIYIPFYSCKTLWSAARAEDCKINFYHIGKDFLPVQEFGCDDYILYINYYGLCDKNCEQLKNVYPNLIIDNTQAFYSDIKGLASFNSLRKFFKVQNGAYLFTEKVLGENFERDKFLYTPVTMQESYEQFVLNEIVLNNENIKTIYPSIEEEMKKFDYEEDKQRRRRKFLKYQSKYGGDNLIKLDLEPDEVPYCYPLSTNNRKIKEELLHQNIPFLTLWGELPKDLYEYEFLNNVAALPLV